MGTSMRPPAAADESRTPARRRGRLAGLAGLAGVVAAFGAALSAGAPAAQADTWGYEQVTPADGGAYSPWAMGLSPDLSTLHFMTFASSVDGVPHDGRPTLNLYGTHRTAGGWTAFSASPFVASGADHVLQGTFYGWSSDGSRSFTGYNAPQLGESVLCECVYSTPRADADASTSLTPFVPGGRADWVYHSANGETAVLLRAGNVVAISGGAGDVVNVDNDGNTMPYRFDFPHQTFQDANPVSADGSKVLFATNSAMPNDNDGSGADLYQRDLDAGTTRVITDDTPDADPDPSAAAEFRWASPDHGRVMWSTTEQFGDDSDDAADLYYRDGDGPITRISQGETVDGSPSGNAANPEGRVDWVMTSEDGNRVYFVSEERLAQDAPAAAGKKLYERDIAEGTTRFVAGPLAGRDVTPGAIGSPAPIGSLLGDVRGVQGPRLRARGLRITSWGAVFQSAAPLAGDTDGETDVFAWTRDDGQLRLISTPEPGAPASASADALLTASLNVVMMGNRMEPLERGRGVGGPGDGRVFLTTGESLTADDTDGGRLDVYAWSTDGSVELVSPAGDAQKDATYLENSPDGSRVFISTDETVLPGDTDSGLIDVYQAILGGGSAPSKPVAPVPAGPAGPAGALPQVPSAPVPASGTPKPVEPVPVDPPLEPIDENDDNDRPEQATLKARAGKRLGADGARLAVKASAAGELRIRAVARVRRGDKLRKTRVADVDERIAAGERTRFDVALSDAAMERLEERGRLRVRFVLRLVPSGDERGAKERVTVTLRSGQRR